ncbi:MAG: calcium-binding protein [Oscillatoria sp. PMC 1068.18]|nr:calcium-binding protein [Oscillatoria sp. PMC 1076.18]MEC4988818.1 calcium-binding protein [Oscillatoria sp. PMC 1068.18]
MTTENFNNTVNELVQDLVTSDNLLTIYNSLSNLDAEALINELTDRDAETILAELSAAGVQDNTITDVEDIVSDLSNEIVSVLSGANAGLVFNFNGDEHNLIGSDENDVIFNIDADDSTLTGENGDDALINIGSGNNTLNGDAGKDFLANFGTGNNTLNGGKGKDLLLNIGTGDNTLNGDGGSDTLINIGTGDNTLNGGGGKDTLINLGSGATLNGDGGNDTLVGGDSDDLLVGGKGSDFLTGGDGSDTFGLYAKSYSSNSSYDWNTFGEETIFDFDASEGDVIQLELTDNFGVYDSNSLSFDSVTGELSLDGNVLATLDGVSDFDVNDVVII